MVERENAVVNNQIILRNYFRYSQTSDYFDPSAISKVEILDSNGTTVLETLTGASIVKSATGKYYVVASAISSAKTVYDKWYFTPAAGATEITKTNTCIVWATTSGSGEGAADTLAELDDIKGYLNLTTEDDDVLLSDIIKRKNAHVKQYCQRDFLQATYTEYHSGGGPSILLPFQYPNINGMLALMLEQYPVSSITAIYDDVGRTYGADSLIDPDNYAIADPNNGIVELDGLSLCKGVKNIKVVYVAGYAASELPEDLKEAFIKLVVAEYLDSKAGINAFKTDNGATRQDTLKKEAYAVLDTYKKVR